ncbi:MAG: GIY-YIG nuclease family protein [Candidatus Poribacteria bacterium]|nr:GIY-YIG nuclease family protein [Candidatus Poribacteria bacterium]
MKAPRIVLIGDESQAGTYVLRIHLKEDTSLQFGRFKKGKWISLPAGDYAYVGSALSEKGATSLARRLVRHATRSGEKRPHRIREKMVEQFAECGLGDGNLLPKRGKTLFWNIDFLLDLEAAEIEGFSAIRSPERLEDRLAKKLEQDPHTQVVERGLGANDVPGNTHLLRVRADESWWGSLPTEFANMIRDGS